MFMLESYHSKSFIIETWFFCTRVQYATKIVQFIIANYYLITKEAPLKHVILALVSGTIRDISLTLIFGRYNNRDVICDSIKPSWLNCS